MAAPITRDGQDALDLAVDAHHVVVGEDVHDGAGQAEGEDGAEDDDEGQQDAAVDQQQDEQHGGEGHAEQQSVDAGEGVGQVDLAGRGARDLGRGAVDGARRLAHLVDDVGQSVTEVGFHLDHRLQGLAVLGGEGLGEGSPTTPGLPASPATARVAAAVWASVTRSPSAVHTTIAGSVSCWSNALRSSRTRVDSALRGRKEAWSLVATSPSFPA